MTLSMATLSIDCHYAEWSVLFIVLVIAVMLCLVMLRADKRAYTYQYAYI
jgi:uncharacterized protein (DUF983 family)